MSYLCAIIFPFSQGQESLNPKMEASLYTPVVKLICSIDQHYYYLQSVYIYFIKYRLGPYYFFFQLKNNYYHEIIMNFAVTSVRKCKQPL